VRPFVTQYLSGLRLPYFVAEEDHKAFFHAKDTGPRRFQGARRPERQRDRLEGISGVDLPKNVPINPTQSGSWGPSEGLGCFGLSFMSIVYGTAMAVDHRRCITCTRNHELESSAEESSALS
jgi:hypothetical protein